MKRKDELESEIKELRFASSSKRKKIALAEDEFSDPSSSDFIVDFDTTVANQAIEDAIANVQEHMSQIERQLEHFRQLEEGCIGRFDADTKERSGPLPSMTMAVPRV